MASPVEPSGASWLLNCFLELGIRIDHKPVVDRVWRGAAAAGGSGRMWIGKADGRVALHPKAGVLMKFLPALTRREEFLFRSDVSVDYVQDFPSEPRRTAQAGFADGADGGYGVPVLMVRDPRDAIYSSYRRSAPALDFAAFLDFPNAATLLGRAAHWALFVAAWLSLPHCHVVRFEEYKRDAEGTLRAVLATLQLEFADHEISQAVRLSSFESARDAERALGDRFAHDRQVANRSGTPGESRQQAGIADLLACIGRDAAPMLHRLGYEAPEPAPGDPFLAARLSRDFLRFFATIHLPAELGAAPADAVGAREILSRLLDFAQRVDAPLLTQAGMAPAEARALLDSLAEFAAGHASRLAARLAGVREAFGDGSGYFFQRIREMRLT